MTEMFKVGSIFTIIDEASPVLKALAKQMTALNDLAAKVQTSLSAIVTVNAQLGDTFSAVNRRMTGTISRMERLAAVTKEYGSAATVAAAQGGVMATVGGRRGGISSEAAGAEEFGAGAFAMGVARGHRLNAALTSIPAMAAGYVAYLAVNKGANVEDAIDRALVAMNIPVTSDYMNTAVAQSIQNAIFATAQRWGRPVGDTSDAALDVIRLLAPRSNADRMTLLPQILDFAAAETRGKPGTTMDEAASIGIALAHQLQDYSPDKIEPVLKAFARLSMATHQSLSQFAQAGSYYLPLLHAGLKMNPTELMAIGAVGSQMGLRSKSGTWLAQLFSAPFTADLTGKRGKARRHALIELGLADASGHLIHVTDPLDFLNTLHSHAAGMSKQQRMADFRAAFGIQGARAASIYTDDTVIKNINDLITELTTSPSISTLQSAYSKSPLTQLQRQEQQFNTQLTKLGEHILPVAIDALRGFVMAIEGISVIANLLRPRTIAGFLDKHAPGVSDALYHIFTPQGRADLVHGAPPPSGRPIHVHTQINMDGRTFAKLVSQHQYYDMNRDLTSGSGFDSRLSFTAPGVP